MKYLCFGTGAIGTYIGGSLALAGQEVVFTERAEVVDVIRRQNLRLSLPDGEHIVADPVIASSIEEALENSPFDAVILAVKSYDTQNLLQSLSGNLSQLPPFICLQNGVENESLLEEVLGKERVIPGTVTSAVGKKGPGNILLERLRGVGLYASQPLSAALQQEFNLAGLNARLYTKPQAMKWSKMLTNLLANATSAILDMTPAEILDSRLGYDLEVAQLREALRVMDALHLPAVNLPGTPVAALAALIRYFPAVLGKPLLAKAAGKGRGGKMPSFHIDLHSGSGKSEVDYLNGAVVRFGRRLGIATPANSLFNDLVNGMTAGEIDPASFNRNPKMLWEMYLERCQTGVAHD